MGRKNSKKNKQIPKRKSTTGKTFEGKLDITRSGMGYVLVKDNDVDIMVKSSDLNSALHGDIVRVKVAAEKSKGRMQGIIIEVLQRKQQEFIGRLEISKARPDGKAGQGFAFMVPETDKPVPDIFIPLSNIGNAIDKDKVVVRILEWPKDGKRPVGEVVSILDAANENDIAMKELLLGNGFSLDFPDDALEVAARIPETISKSEIKKRKDFRDILTFTIDPVDAKDFDDAISFQQLQNGNYEIGVHIADVSHYVEPETPLDSAAFEKGTSVYLPDRVSPMLPEHISNFLCSLRPQEDKLTFSAVFEISPKAELKNIWIGKTIIHSNHRFTYEEVQEIIEVKDGIYKKEILSLNLLAQHLRQQRFKKGAINFSSQEVRFKLDEKGKPIGIVIKESKEAHQLIEEFMLLANKAVAQYISEIKFDKKPVPLPYRVHDVPDKDKLLPFISFAHKFGHQFDTSSPGKIASSFNLMLNDVRGKPEQHVLEQLGIRTMSKAKYTTNNIGHYGLGFQHYCHFTSPIRRFPDILVHRILESLLNNSYKADKKLEEKCIHCSERERAAMETERAANKYKQVEYMKNFMGDEFEGIISGVAAFGFWVETVEHKCEGLVSVNSLFDYDNFKLIEGEYCLAGERTGRKFRMGDKIWIKVVAANLTKRQLDYEWVIATGLKAGKKKKK